MQLEFTLGNLILGKQTACTHKNNCIPFHNTLVLLFTLTNWVLTFHISFAQFSASKIRLHLTSTRPLSLLGCSDVRIECLGALAYPLVFTHNQKSCACQLHSVISNFLWSYGSYGLSGSWVHGILQMKIREWVAISFSRGFSWARDQTLVSCSPGKFFTIWTTRGRKGRVFDSCGSVNTFDEWQMRIMLSSFLPGQGLRRTVLKYIL